MRHSKTTTVRREERHRVVLTGDDILAMVAEQFEFPITVGAKVSIIPGRVEPGQVVEIGNDEFSCGLIVQWASVSEEGEAD